MQTEPMQPPLMTAMREELTSVWGLPPHDEPGAFVDGQRLGEDRTSGTFGTIFKANDKTLPKIMEKMDVETLMIHSSRATDFSVLANQSRLKRLWLNWAVKLETLDFVEHLPPLDVLMLDDIKKVTDLSPLRSQPSLKALMVAGGMFADIQVESLSPIADLEHLSEFYAMSMRVQDDAGPRPLAACASLTWLWLPNTFPVEDFAYLATRLPKTKCSKFQGYETVHGPGKKNVMVTGSRKPFLNKHTDAAKLARYVAQFEELKKKLAPGTEDV